MLVKIRLTGESDYAKHAVNLNGGKTSVTVDVDETPLHYSGNHFIGYLWIVLGDVDNRNPSFIVVPQSH
jgi:hypothetical protein